MTRPARTWTPRSPIRPIHALAGSGKPYVQISGAWIYGNDLAVAEESPVDRPALVAWREPIDQRVLGATGMRGVVIVSGTAYGDAGGGVPGVLLGSPRDDAGRPDHARQRRAALGDGARCRSRRRVPPGARGRRSRGSLRGADGANPTLADVTSAVATAVGAPGAVPGSDDEARARLGDYFAEVLLLDQSATAARARTELGCAAPRTPGWWRSSAAEAMRVR